MGLGTLSLSGNVIYGMTQMGGANSNGLIFSIKTSGSGYKDLLDFSSSNGINPFGELTVSGNILYGMTSAGGTNGSGVIFSYNNGSSPTPGPISGNSTLCTEH